MPMPNLLNKTESLKLVDMIYDTKAMSMIQTYSESFSSYQTLNLETMQSVTETCRRWFIAVDGSKCSETGNDF